MNKIHLFLILLFFSSPIFAYKTLNTTLFTGITYDDNTTRAELNSDIENDSIVNIGVFSTYKYAINKTSYIIYSASADFNQYINFDKLNHLTLDISASYKTQPTQGYTAPWYAFSFAYKLLAYKNNNRDGVSTNIGIDFGKRLTDIMSLRAGYHIENIDADANPPAFDADNNRFYVNIDYKLNPSNTLYVTLSHTDGDIVATTAPTQKIIDAAHGDIIDDSEVFGTNRYAYRLDATTIAFTLGDNYAISQQQAIDASLLYYTSSAYGGNDYGGIILQLTYLHSF